jgi:chromosome segregation ATPase
VSEAEAEGFRAVQRQLDALRSELQKAVAVDILTQLARPEPQGETELQRRARLGQLELAIRHQALALEQWPHRLAETMEAAEARRQLFTRLESEFRQTIEAAEQREAALRTELAESRAALDAVQAERATLRQEKAALEHERAQERTALEASLSAARTELDTRRATQIEAERRIEELRSSRWRQFGIGLGLAKRASFET